MTLYIDLDGVLADFDAGYAALSGMVPDTRADNVNWDLVLAHPGLYATLAPMPDMAGLWAYVQRYAPVVLTGIPVSVPGAAADKRTWVRTSTYGVVSRKRNACMPRRGIS